MYKYLQPGALSTKFIVQMSKDSAWISRQTDDTAVFFSDTVVVFLQLRTVCERTDIYPTGMYEIWVVDK